jgi:hypothetical protein
MIAAIVGCGGFIFPVQTNDGDIDWVIQVYSVSRSARQETHQVAQALKGQILP